MEIKIECTQVDSVQLKKHLETFPIVDESEIDFQIHQSALRMRGADPTVLVAVIGAAGSSLAALITSIFTITKEKQLGKVIIESKDGTKIEIPSSYPVEKLDAIIDKVRQIETDRILIAK